MTAENIGMQWKGNSLKANASLSKKNPSKLVWGEDYNVDIQNSSSWVSRSGISGWNLQSPSYNFFIYPLILVSSHERPLRKCYFQWIMLNCLAEALPRWSSLLQNIALSALAFWRACPMPLQLPLLWLRLCCSWCRSSHLYDIWSNHRPFVIQSVRQHKSIFHHLLLYTPLTMLLSHIDSNHSCIFPPAQDKNN